MTLDPSAPGADRHDVTALLRAHRAGDEQALEALTPLVYDELHAIAHRQLSFEQAGRTLRTTGLVHEAFARFMDLDRIQMADRAHFFALSARMMRQILTDHARRRAAAKRDGVKVPLEERDGLVGSEAASVSLDTLIDLDRALTSLADRSERQARIVECRFYAGMSVPETAEAIGLSPATVKREWQIARAWLNRELAQ